MTPYKRLFERIESKAPSEGIHMGWVLLDVVHKEINDDSIEWDGKAMIGNVDERFKQLERKGWDWSSFYNGWLEGRFKMLEEITRGKKNV